MEWSRALFNPSPATRRNAQMADLTKACKHLLAQVQKREEALKSMHESFGRAWAQQLQQIARVSEGTIFPKRQC